MSAQSTSSADLFSFIYIVPSTNRAALVGRATRNHPGSGREGPLSVECIPDTLALGLPRES
jgi:hypothetical protein